MIPFIAALPAIFSAISSATELFDVGKKVVEEVTKEKHDISTPSGLEQVVENLTPEQKSAFCDRMKAEIAEYDAITERLTQQGGLINAETLHEIPPQERGKIAVMRMTTRPWAVRWMVIAVVFPPLSTISINLLISLYNVLNAGLSATPNQISLISLDGVLNDLYMSMVGWASGVIMTYMGMREIGKYTGSKDSVSISDIKGSVGGLIKATKSIFRN